MRIKIIGDNNCARATRHLLRMAGFAVTEFLPAEAITHAPHFGYAITIDLSPAPHSGHTPPAFVPNAGTSAGLPALGPNAGTSAGLPALVPDHSTHGQLSPHIEEASALAKATADVSSPSFEAGTAMSAYGKGTQAEACATFSHIHFDSVDSALEAGILRHVTQLAAAPVVLDRPGGVVHSERELRIVIPCTGVVKTDEAAAVAVEFGVLRGLLDLTTPRSPRVLIGATADKSAEAPRTLRSEGGKKWWNVFSVAIFAWSFLALAAGAHASLSFSGRVLVESSHAVEARGRNGAYLRLAASLAPPAAQGEFSTGQQTQITDGTNTLVVDPCKGQPKNFLSINQTANTQLAAGTSSKKIYICSIHVVVAAATNVALVEGTGSVCVTGTSGVGGFGGATAATGWNFAANGGIVLGDGSTPVGAEVTSGDNLCLYNSGSGQVSGGISYVVQ